MFSIFHLKPLARCLLKRLYSYTRLAWTTSCQGLAASKSSISIASILTCTPANVALLPPAPGCVSAQNHSRCAAPRPGQAQPPISVYQLTPDGPRSPHRHRHRRGYRLLAINGKVFPLPSEMGRRIEPIKTKS